MEEKYYELLKPVLSQKSLSETATGDTQEHLTKAWVEATITEILSLKNNRRKTNTAATKSLLSRYDVIIRGGQKKLILKVNSKIKNIIVPIEESYNLLRTTHLNTKHGNIYNMYYYVSRSGFVVDQVCYPILKRACIESNSGCVSYIDVAPVPIDKLRSHLVKPDPAGAGSTHTEHHDTNRHKYSKRKKRNTKECTMPIPKLSKQRSVAFVTVLDMSERIDNSYKYILVFKDCRTGFVQLRPLMDKDTVAHIHLELLKLFCDFDPPKYIVVKVELLNIFKNVMRRVNKSLKIAVRVRGRSTHFMIRTEGAVERGLLRWLQKSNSWSIGCYSVQWKINSKIDSQYGSPFKYFFGEMPLPYDKKQLTCLENNKVT